VSAAALPSDKVILITPWPNWKAFIFMLKIQSTPVTSSSPSLVMFPVTGLVRLYLQSPVRALASSGIQAKRSARYHALRVWSGGTTNQYPQNFCDTSGSLGALCERGGPETAGVERLDRSATLNRSVLYVLRAAPRIRSSHYVRLEASVRTNSRSTSTVPHRRGISITAGCR
jgi:hypothetical protein